MLRRLATGVAAPAILLTVFLIATALPGSSQTAPTVADLIDEVDQIEGLDPLDPVLNEVSGVVLDLLGAVDELLADAPVVNALALGGDDVIDAGVAFSQATFPDGAATAILSREDLFPDAFSTGVFQGVNDAPLLFTDSDDLDPRTGMELQRLGMSNITILGGEDALHPLVVQKLEIAGLNVTRVGGPTRVETSVLAAQATNPGATTALLVRAYPDAGQPDSQAYADLLAAGPYAAENDWPVLMTTSDSLHPAVEQYLSTGSFMGVGGGVVTDVVIIGGTNAVSQQVEDQLTALGLNVRRVAGDNRFATAVAIAGERGYSSSADVDRVIIAASGSRDDVWGPGVAATAHADLNSAPVLLVDGATVPSETLEFVLNGLVENLTDGGAAVVCASFVNPLACQTVALLMIGDIAGALEIVTDLLEILGQLPVVGEILAALGLAELLPAALQNLYATLVAGGVDPGTVEEVLAGIASGDLAVAQTAIEDAATELGTDPAGLLGATPDTIEQIIDGTLDPLDPIGDAVDGVDDVVDDVLGIGEEEAGVDDTLDDVVDVIGP